MDYIKTQQRIKELRKEKGWTQENLGQMIGVKGSAVAKYENGRVKNIKREVLQKISNVFSVQVSYILGESDFKTEEEEFSHVFDSTYPIIEANYDLTLKEYYLPGLRDFQNEVVNTLLVDLSSNLVYSLPLAEEDREAAYRILFKKIKEHIILFSIANPIYDDRLDSFDKETFNKIYKQVVDFMNFLIEQESINNNHGNL